MPGTLSAYDSVAGAHGRGPAIATGIKRVARRCGVQPPGRRRSGIHCAAEILHAANRGGADHSDHVNNAVYGMTGGQMAPTTLLGQVTSTSPFGRDQHNRMAYARAGFGHSSGGEILARVCASDAANVIKAGAAIRKLLRSSEGTWLRNRRGTVPVSDQLAHGTQGLGEMG